MSEEDYDMIFKTVLIGDSGVGKTNLLLRYMKNDFNNDTKATVGVEFSSKRFELDGYSIKAQIWDTAGQERYKSITNAYYKGAKGALLVYDVSRPETFENVDKWVPDLRSNGDSDVTILLVGNKCDLVEQRLVSREEGENKAKLYNIAFIETSALQSVNVHEAFKIMIEEIFKKCHKQLEEQVDAFSFQDGNKGIELLKDEKGDKDLKKKCC